MTLVPNLWAFNTCRDCFKYSDSVAFPYQACRGQFLGVQKATGYIPGRRKSFKYH